ncbi:MAG: lipoyl synthase [Endomicrobium sp.]|nr:lipoyl synthase [Endomicrobium sp.]
MQSLDVAKLAKKRISVGDVISFKKEIKLYGLNTVCQSTKCPNIGECFKNKIATFLILGKNCTRKCSFCSVQKHKPEHLNEKESIEIAKLIKKMGLSYSVITSVTRDDLPDGGASYFVKTIFEIKKIVPQTKVEVLVPDFLGNISSVDMILNAKPDVFAHNLETVSGLYDKVRIGADYMRSLNILKHAKSFSFQVKTGIMVGLGESKEQLFKTIEDIKNANIDTLTIGQYLSPTKDHYPIIKEYTDEEFKRIEDFAVSIGIKQAIVGRYVRSSYLSEKYFKKFN